MGGYGSGRGYRWDKKAIVEDCRTLDVNKLARDGMLVPHLTGTLAWTKRSTGEVLSTAGYSTVPADNCALLFRLNYRLVRIDQHVECPIQLQTTTPNYGGVRWWFTCPLITRDIPCRRRVAKLHLPRGARYYGCRHCYDLTYESCQDSHKYDREFAEVGAKFGLSGKQVKDMLTERWQL